MSPVVPYFPHSRNFRGHYSEKCGIWPELLHDARRELMRSDIAMFRRQKAGGDVVWDAVRYRQGDVLTKNLRDNEGFCKAKKQDTCFCRTPYVAAGRK
jgi:hypothetical protein